MITTKVKWKAIFVSLFFLCLYLFLLYIVIFIAVYITYTYTTDEDDTDSRQELAEKGYTLPEYAFVVECDGATSGESGVLEVPILFLCVQFRTSNNYKGEYGFDWLRNGDSGRLGDVDYREIIGNYDDGKFVVKKEKYEDYLKKYFPSFQISKWRSYYTPVMTLLKGRTACLSLDITDNGVAEEIVFDYDHSYFHLSKDSLLPPGAGRHNLLDVLHVTCKDEFNHEQLINVYAYGRKGDDNTKELVGRLKIRANDKTHQRQVKIVLVTVVTPNGNGENDEEAQEPVEINVPRIQELQQYLEQCYFISSISEVELDLSNLSDFYEYMDKNKGKLIREKIDDLSLFEYLERKFSERYPDHKESYKAYLFSLDTNGKNLLYGMSMGIPSKSVIVLKKGLGDSTLAHELFHSLGLYHSFSNKGQYTFEKYRTDNLMDYSDLADVSIPIIATWQFQWDRLQEIHE